MSHSVTLFVPLPVALGVTAREAQRGSMAPSPTRGDSHEYQEIINI
jgi:hypothetical protein